MKYLQKIVVLLLCCWSLTVGRAGVTPFRFAQFTDVHLNPGGDGPTHDLMKCIAQVNETPGLDFVLVTGDLTEQGDRFMMRKVKDCLQQLKIPYYVYLGNHETTWSESGCTAFQEIFGPETQTFEHKGVTFIGFNSGPLMRMAYGHVSPFDIDYLKKQLAASPDKPAIIVTHYPMTEGDVDNWYNVTDAARRTGNVRLFIGGHYHSMRKMSYDGIPGVLMRSTLRDGNGRPGYGVYEVTDSEIKVYQQNVGEAPTLFATFDLLKATYDPNGKAQKYPDYSDNERFPEVTESWVTSTTGAFYSSPAVEKKRVFTGDNEGNIKAFSLKDGKLLWQFQTGRRIIGGPAVSKGIVVCGSADMNIYGLRASDGKLLWKHSARRPVLGAVTIADGVAYIGASDSTLRAIDVKTGQLVWAYRGVRGYIVSKPLVTHDKVIFGAWDNTLYALARGTGKELWKWTGGLTRMHFSPASVWPQAADGRVFIVDPQRAMTAINLENGETLWRTFQSKVRESMGLSADGKRVYAKTMEDSLVCYAAADSPHELWACNVGFGYEHGPCMPQEKDGVVFCSTKDGLIFAVEGKTGQLLWRHKVGNSLMSTVVPLSAKEILFSNTDGQVGLLRVKQVKKK